MSLILVNATSTRSSGALSILNQFIAHIASSDCNQYCIFVDTNYKEIVHQPNIKYVHVDTTTWKRRICWDNWGLKRYARQHKLHPSLIVSLQNTGVRFDKEIPQLIYYHQPFPVFPKRWSFFKRQERLFFLYKYIYSLFVAQSIRKDVSFVVQIPSIKKAFVKRFSISSDSVYVIPPEVQKIDYDAISASNISDGKKHFIYPATPYLYKNHTLLLQALHLIKAKDEILFQKIRVHFTLQKNNPLCLDGQARALGVEEAIVYEGVLPFQKLLSYYKSMDALLFPSYIETFGLPLLEAAGAGIAIVASDLPYAHDVIGEYEGVTYLDYQDAKAWALVIENLCVQERKNYPSFLYPSDRGNWSDFFALIEKMKNKN